MSPSVDRIKIPDGLVLEARQTCQQSRVDERPRLRTADGHVLAVVEVWRPELAN